MKIMAWTKAKTAIVAAAGVILVAGTTTLIFQPRHHFAIQRDIPRDSWVFAGYGDPESTLVSFLWAVRQADGDKILASCSPELQQEFQAHFGEQAQARGESLSEFIAQDARPHFESFSGIRVLSLSPVAADRIEMHVFALGEEKEHLMTVRKIRNEWKVDQVFQ